MYHIAICDDDSNFTAYIKRIINNAKGNGSIEFKFYEFTSGEALINRLKDMSVMDLLILDMELGGMDGDETAACFRKKFKDSVLVFCSGVRAPTVKSFRVTPYRYLLKSYSDKQFVSEMKEILEEMTRRSKDDYILGHYRGDSIKIKVRDVLYIENAKRGSRITVSTGEEYEGFGDTILVDDKLNVISRNHETLVFAHASYLINISHVERITGNEVHLDNGECLTVSRTYFKSFREAFTRSIASKY